MYRTVIGLYYGECLTFIHNNMLLYSIPVVMVITSGEMRWARHVRMEIWVQNFSRKT
jgi:hypothetical protein